MLPPPSGIHLLAFSALIPYAIAVGRELPLPLPSTPFVSRDGSRRGRLHSRSVASRVNPRRGGKGGGGGRRQAGDGGPGGPPGSGKSTFAEAVIGGSAARPWARVCQDTIGNGKAGTKIQCLKAMADALKEGKSILIDRCNLEHEQRTDFVKLGSTVHSDVHAVVLDLPAKVCISRSVNRTGHEGNLQGGKAAMVVNRMLQEKETPLLTEGFSRIMFCKDGEDIKKAVDMYNALGPSDSLPSGVFGQKSKGLYKLV